MSTLPEGVRRHETCRFGMLTYGVRINAATGEEAPVLPVLCLWKPENAPPALTRVWSGLIEYADCVGCKAYEELP